MARLAAGLCRGEHAGFRDNDTKRETGIYRVEPVACRTAGHRSGGHFSDRAALDAGAENSLTAYDVAAGSNSLTYAAIWWPIAFALATTYFVFVSRRYAGKVSVERDNQGFY